MTDDEIKQAMRSISQIAGLKLTDDRIEKDMPSYKRHLAAIESFAAVKIPLETEPGPLFQLKKRG